MRRAIRWSSALILFLLALLSFYLAAAMPEKSGGRGGLLTTGVLFLVFGYALAGRRKQ